ncbi:MAG: ADP-ribosylglycohydrolase family protein [Eubacteriales bacterium]|nr:ADP-ribosylglycohydrolase family protein [Eubacteriales bacterium]
MPGCTDWKHLYLEEYQQLQEEGYPVGNSASPEKDERYLPIASSVAVSDDAQTDLLWKESYEKLWKIREKGIRSDYPYQEPDALEEIWKSACPMTFPKLSKEEYEKRIYGAWFGRISGIVLGKPLEMGLNRRKIEKYLRSTNNYPLHDWVAEYSKSMDFKLREDCIPSTHGHVAYAQSDDDIHYTVLALLLAEQKGLDFTAMDVGENLLNNVPYHWLWCSSRQMYYHLVKMSEVPELKERLDSLKLFMNPFRECIDGQISADFWGYIQPGSPAKAAMLAHRAASFSLVKNGVYGAMFVAGCIASALTPNPSIEQILDGGLSVIPCQSRLYEAITRVRDWYNGCKEWTQVCDQIEKVYGHLPFGGTINNLSLTVLALLEGRLDHARTIETAVMCGTDTDCNAGTAGSIVGAAVGYDKLDARWIAPLQDRVKTVVAGFGEGSIHSLCDRTIAVCIRQSSPFTRS